MPEAMGIPDGKRSGFYVEADCCLLCGVPEAVAPELFRTRDEGCFVIRQPCSSGEIDRAIEAMWAGEVDCIRYGGSDPAILKRIGEAGMAEQADDAVAAGFPPLIRDRVSFSVAGAQGAGELAAMFRSHVRAIDRFTLGSSILPNTVKFSWWRRHFHSVSFKAAADPMRIAILRPDDHRALHGLARVVDEWLHSSCQAQSVVWHTSKTLKEGLGGASYPF